MRQARLRKSVRHRGVYTLQPLFLFIISILSLISPRHIGAQEQKRAVEITWQVVTGATRYLVEVRALHGDVVFSQSTTGDKVSAELSPGEYQVRVTAYNLFDKPASSSPWRDLHVVLLTPPIFDAISPSTFYTGTVVDSVTIAGGGFSDHVSVDIEQHGEVIAPVRVEAHTGTDLTAALDLKSVPPGTYDLVLTNPTNLITTATAAIHVLPRVQPVLSSIGRDSGYNDRLYPDVTIAGSGLSPATSITLRDGSSVIKATEVKTSEAGTGAERQLQVDLNLGGAAPGWYDLVAVNPGGLQGTIPRAFQVLPIKAPVVDRVEPVAMTIGSSDGSFTIYGSNFIPGTLVFLESGSKKVPATVVGEKSLQEATGGDQELSCKVDPGFLGPGQYDLIVRNSDLLSVRLGREFTILPLPLPRIASITPNSGRVDRDYKDVVVDGDNFKPGDAVFLSKGQLQYRMTSTFVSSSQYRIDLDLAHLPAGEYDVMLIGEKGVEATLPAAFLIEPRPSVPAKSSTPVAARQIRLSLGYPASVFLSSNLSTRLPLSLLGVELNVDLPVGASLMPRVPILRGVGVEVGGRYTSFNATGTANAFILVGTTSLYYRTSFRFPLNAVIRAGWGVALADYSADKSALNFGSSVFGYVISVALSAEIDLGKHIALGPGVRWTRLFGGSASVDMASAFVRAGVRLGD